MGLKPGQLPRHIIFAVCDRFLRGVDENGKRITAKDVSDWLKDQGYDISREGIYRIVRIGIDRGYAQLCPPLNEALRARLQQRFPNAGDVRVLDVRQPADVVDNLAGGAADLIVELIRQVAADRPRRGSRKRRAVHLGFGGGGTSLRVAQRLAQRLQAEAALPPLTIHALTSGFDIERPLSAPGAFLSLFDDLRDVRFVGLFCPPFVEWDRFEEDRELPGIREAFELAQDVDIVVTSLAQAGDDHGLLNWFFQMYGGDDEIERLRSHGHRGDILWQPYSDEGPLENTSIRAFTLFDLPTLVRMSATPGKHVVAVAGPCVECKATKEGALLPLLRRPELRVFNHLVSDTDTIAKLIPKTRAA